MSVASTVIVLCGIIALGAMLYGWLEAGWLRTRVLDVPVAPCVVGLILARLRQG